MSRACTLCGKVASRANHVSHSKQKVPRHQKPNLQLMTVGSERIKTCSTCRRTLNKKLA